MRKLFVGFAVVFKRWLFVLSGRIAICFRRTNIILHYAVMILLGAAFLLEAIASYERWLSLAGAGRTGNR